MINRLRLSRHGQFSAILIFLIVGIISSASHATEPGVHGRVNGFNEDGKYVGVVSGAAIEIKNQGGAVVDKTTSGKTGYYRFNLPPGNYFFKVTAEGYKEEDKGRGFALQLSEGLAVYNFTLTKGKMEADSKPPKIPETPIGQLKGRVLEQVTKGVLVGIPNATITLRLAEQLNLVEVVSGKGEPDKPDTVGKYQLNMAQGSWKASVVADGFERLVDADAIEIVAGETSKRDFILTRIKTPAPSAQGINGVVNVVGSERTSITPDKVKLNLIPLGNGQRTAAAPAANGKYQKDLGVGRYRVVASATGYRDARSGPVFVFRGQYSRVDLTLFPETGKPPSTPPVTSPIPNKLVFQGEVGILVDGKTFQPIQGAMTRLIKRGQGLRNLRPTRTDKNGKASFPVSDPGDYLFLAQNEGYRAGTKSVKVAVGEENKVRLILEPLDSSTTPSPTRPIPSKPVPSEKVTDISGWVVYESKESSTGYFGVGGTTMGWTRLSPKPPVTQEKLNEKAGNFKLKIPAGTYLVSLQPPTEFEPMRKQVVVVAGMKPEYFILKKKGSTQPQPTPSTPTPSNDLVRVNGYVVYRSKTSSTGYGGIPGARLEWRRTDRVSGNRNVTSVTIGRYDTQLSPGSYSVRVVPPRGYQGTTENVTVRKGMGAKYFILKPSSSVTPSTPGTPPTTSPRTYALTVRVLGSAPVISSTAPRNTNRSLSGAYVTVRQGLRTVTSGRTAKDGSITFKLRAGTYTIDARNNGYTTGRQSVSLTRGNASTTISLRKTSTGSSKPTFPKPIITIPKTPTKPKPNFKLPKTTPKKK